MNLGEKMVKTMLEAMAGEVYVTPVRREDMKSVRKNWSKDWFKKSEIPEWMKTVSGWDDLSNDGFRDVEEPFPVVATFEVNIGRHCVELASDISWDCLPPGTYNKIRGRNSSGELLWEIPIFPGPLEIHRNGPLIITNMMMELGH